MRKLKVTTILLFLSLLLVPVLSNGIGRLGSLTSAVAQGKNGKQKQNLAARSTKHNLSAVIRARSVTRACSSIL
jgi:hypothetical protein